jgi:GT2 family glycosyltransferase
MHASLAEWPIRFASQPAITAEKPKISFIFAHGGDDRLPQLRQTIRSVFAQEEVPCEVVVIDQSAEPQMAMLPAPVIYRHLSKEGVPPGWYKSWAYNVGARLAAGSILVFQDGDVCAPARYARELVDAIETRGHAAASVQRILFYLNQADSQSVQMSNHFAAGIRPTLVFQNWKGGTIAIRKDAFMAIGGFDEGFVNWGGEDDEFYDRCALIGHCRSGYLPFVHLWHIPQASRPSATNANPLGILPSRLSVPSDVRSLELSQRRFGDPHGPDPRMGYKNQLASGK